MSQNESDRRRALAQRVADAHRPLAPADELLAFVSGSVVDELADARSDVDMSVVFERVQAERELQAACERAGGQPWFWQAGTLADGGMVVAFRLDGIEVQIGYSDRRTLVAHVDELLVEHRPDTPTHKLGEGILKAEPLAGDAALRVLQTRLAAFPPELGRAMVVHFLSLGAPWRAVSQLLHRDGALWCRELLVEASYGAFGVLAGLNARYFARFQFKRMRKFASSLDWAPAHLVEQVEALLTAPPREAFVRLHALEGALLERVEARLPEVDTATIRRRRADFQPD
jgi:hypothetical protein